MYKITNKAKKELTDKLLKMNIEERKNYMDNNMEEIQKIYSYNNREKDYRQYIGKAIKKLKDEPELNENYTIVTLAKYMEIKAKGKRGKELNKTKHITFNTNETYKNYLPIKGQILSEYQKKIIQLQKKYNEK